MAETRTDTQIWLEPVRGGTPDIRLFGLTGQQQLDGFLGGLSLPPPIHHLTGMTITEATPGRSTFTMPVTPWLVAPPGMVHPGALAILADGPSAA